jgi:hypothetical protein
MAQAKGLFVWMTNVDGMQSTSLVRDYAVALE